MKNNARQRPFGIADKLGYLFGDLGNDFTFILSSTFLLKFYTDVMGIDPLTVGAAMMVSRIADGFTDIAMGRICDKSHPTAAGKFKPWLLRMCVPVALSSFLMYQSVLSGAGITFKTVWLFVTYILWGSFFYTSVNIPYGSMASAISPEPEHRQSLSTFRTMGGAFAGVIVGVIVPAVAYKKDSGGNEILDGGIFTVVAGVFSVLTVVCYLLCYFLVTERVSFSQNTAAHQSVSIGKMLTNALQNRALISIIIASIIMLMAQLTLQSMANYVYPNYYRSAAAQSASNLVMLAGMIISAVLVKPLSKRLGKAELSAASSFLAAAACIALYFVRPQSVLVYIGFIFFCWLGLGMFSMVTWAMITDVIDYSELKNGIREDGSVYALYSFARKLGQAISAGLSGWLLTAIGYTQATAFDTNVLEGIFDISALVPGIDFVLLGLVLLLWYPLHKKQVIENTEALKKRHFEKNIDLTK